MIELKSRIDMSKVSSEAVDDDSYKNGYEAGQASALPKIRTQAKIIKILKDALEFYADRKNWDDRWVEENDDDGGDIFDVITREDVELGVDEKEFGLDKSYIEHWTHGGKKAREAIAQIAKQGDAG